MRSVRLRNPKDPALKKRLANWQKRAKEATEKVCKAPAAKRKEVMDAHQRVYQDLKEYLLWLFGGRCAYCEKLLDEYGRVEHYRPRDLYYWLTFDRKNLLLSCEACNGRKSNQFPVAGKRKEAPGSQLQEDPLLLCPYDAGSRRAPERHLTFVADPREPNYGWAVPVKNSAYGERSIEVYNLKRETLREARKKAMDLFRRKFGDSLTNAVGLDRVIVEVETGCEYSAACQAALDLARQQIERALAGRR